MASRVTFVLSSGVGSLYLVGYFVHEDRNREELGPSGRRRSHQPIVTDEKEGEL